MSKFLFKVQCISYSPSHFGATESIFKLKIGHIYAVKKVEIHSWYTKYLIGQKWFNSINFKKIT